MAKKSAGMLAFYFDEEKNLRVLLVHPGGPFFIKKDLGYWSIPKGEYEEGEEPLQVALREFNEETGNRVTAKQFLNLGTVKLSSGKVITAYAAEQFFDTPFVQSNVFEMEWPPKSGRKQWFAETDNAAWFTPEEAKQKMYASQHPFIDRLLAALSLRLPPTQF